MTHAQQNIDRQRPYNKLNTFSTPSTTIFSLSSLPTTSSYSNPRRFFTRIFFLSRFSLIKSRGEEVSALLRRSLESLIFRGLMEYTSRKAITISWPRPSLVLSCVKTPIVFLVSGGRLKETLGRGSHHGVREWSLHPTLAPRSNHHPTTSGAKSQEHPDLSNPL